MNILVTKTRYYFDGHGVPDAGRIEYFITNNENYLHLNPEHYYTDDAELVEEPDFKPEWLEEAIKTRHDLCASDGYNCAATTYNVEQVDDTTAEHMASALKEYDRLFTYRK